ncbi:cytoskeleton assembly control protein SLA1p [Histoplasma capsulatum var. duboisii H88]|uniref:Actin cytoskeleton-regulatory complex protein SLA1 n=1 Tax=Ajellomyces capsulatus (strain H88) TaxID=544711 RepID=A0A8A1LN72_AJEC8|nr:cytoskeleton assembly control protein SLA1p [Histoplasma capsulatum var. duboisii H88]
MGFLGVYTAVYDYTPQAENELEIKEGDLLYVMDKSVEDDWWKAKKKAAEDDEEEPVGLVPNNYVEEAQPISKAKALYDYTRQTDEEVSFAEQVELVVYDTSDPDWTLVGVNNDFGFAPANYIEITEEFLAKEASPAPPHSLPTKSAETESEGALTPASHSSADASPAAALAGILHKSQPSISEQSRPVPSPQAPQPARQPTFTPEESDGEDATPPPALPRRPPSQQNTPSSQLPSPRDPSPPRPKHAPLRDEESYGVQPSPPYRSGEFNPDQRSAISPSGYHLYNISEMVSVMGKRKKMPTTLGININTGTIFISPEKSIDGPHQEWTADKLTHYSIEGKHVFMDLIRPSKSVDFHAGAKDTANEIVSALGEIAGGYRAEGLREVIAAGTGGARKKGQVLYDFMAQGDDEVTVAVGDEVIILDDSKSDEWWMVRRLKTGREGVVPSSYVELTGVVTTDEPSRKGTNAGLSTVEQNRLEESRLTKETARKSKSHDSSNSRGGERQKRDSRSKPKPDPLKTRKWTDRTGTFTVVAEFIGLAEGKIHLHKQNGVKIAVPVSKMSVDDLEYVEQVTGQSLDEDKPLSDIRRRSRLNDAGKVGASVKSSDYDWFDFFLKAGVGPHQCERYSHNFNKDSMDESVLPDITTETLRTLGLKEGDILRVMKYLDNLFNRTAKSKMVSFGGEEVIGNGEEGAGGLFSGPGGALRNNTRKGRPAPAVQTSDVVDPKAFEGKSGSKPSSPTGAPEPAGPTKGTITQGFEDSAWEVRHPKQADVSTAPPSAPSSAPSSAPAPTATTQAAPATQSPPGPPVGAMADLSLLSTPLQPTKVQHSSLLQTTPAPISQAPPQIQQPQQTGANPTFFAQLGPQQQQQPQTTFQPQVTGYVSQQQPMPPRQRPQPPAKTNQGSSLLPPPPDRPLSAPQHLHQNSFGPPPLQPQLTGIPASTPNIAPPGRSLAELNQQRFQTQFNQQSQPQQIGMGSFGSQISPQQQPQYAFQSPQPFLNGPQQNIGQQGFQQPLMPQQTGFPSFPTQQQHSIQPVQPMEPMQTGINSVLSPPMQPQRTGMNGFGGNASFNPSPPPIPPIPHQPTVAPLQPQKTGPAPPVRFGVHKDAKKLTPQQTGLKANLSQATPSNPFGF